MAIVADRGWGDWWLTDPGLSPTRVTRAQADVLLAGVDGVEVLDAGASDVRFGGAVGDLLVNLADGRWLALAEDGRIAQDVTEAFG